MIWRILLWTLGALLALWLGSADAATRYTTTTAAGGLSTGDCLTTGTRCTNARAIVVAVANDVISMAGNTMASPLVYQGANDMLKITSKSGLSLTQPILVRCEVAGGCLIDGQFQREPLSLSASSYWLFEDFNVKNGTNQPTNCVNGGDNTGGGVIRLASQSNSNLFNRLIAWDACISPNAVVVNLDHSDNNTFIDLAAFGTGRKVFQVYIAHGNVCRRCWFRWEGSLGAVTTTVTTNYRSSPGLTLENGLVTWTGEMMPETYNDSENGLPKTNYAPNEAIAILTSSRTETASTPKNVNVNLRGVLVYAGQNDRLPTIGSDGHPFTGYYGHGSSAITITDLVTFIHPQNAAFTTTMGMITSRRKHNCPCTDPPGSAACATQSSGPCENPVVGNSITRGLSIRGTKTYGANSGDSFGANNIGTTTGTCTSLNQSCFTNETDWTRSNVLSSTSYDVATMSPWQDTATNRARLCYRTENGVVTTTPLWPWPMNDRIKEATKQADKYTGPCPTCATGGVSWQTSPTVPNMTPRPSRLTKHPNGYDVTADMELLFGMIPAACKEGAPVFVADPTFAPALLTAFGSTATPPTGFSRFTGTLDWAEAGGVASAPASYGWMRWNTGYGANQQVAAPVTALPNDGASVCVGFHMVDPANRWSACARRITGTGADVVDLTQHVAGVPATIGSQVLGFEVSTSDEIGVNVAAGKVNYKTAAWGEWRTVLTFTPPTAPATSYLGVASSSPATVTSFRGQGTTTTPDTTPPNPDPPTGVTVTAGTPPSTQLVVDSALCTDLVGVVAYLTHRGLVSDCSDCVLVGTSDTPLYTDNNLAPSTTYYYRRKCTDGTNPSVNFSAIVSATTATASDGVAPTVPGGVTALLGASELKGADPVPTVVVTWTASTDSGGSGLKEYVVLAGSTSDCSNCQELCRTTALTVTHSLRDDAPCRSLVLPFGETTYYQVKAEDVAGNVSAGSTVSGALTPAAAQYTNVSGRAR